MARIKIDIHELTFLAEACIPPKPIARTMFWQRLVNEIYNQLDDYERKFIFEIITKKENFSLQDADCKWFYYRFNPDNQYKVGCCNGKAQRVKAFLRNDLFYINTTTHINPKCIKWAKKIKIKK